MTISRRRLNSRLGIKSPLTRPEKRLRGAEKSQKMYIEGLQMRNQLRAHRVLSSSQTSTSTNDSSPDRPTQKPILQGPCTAAEMEEFWETSKHKVVCIDGVESHRIIATLMSYQNGRFYYDRGRGTMCERALRHDEKWKITLV